MTETRHVRSICYERPYPPRQRVATQRPRRRKGSAPLHCSLHTIVRHTEVPSLSLKRACRDMGTATIQKRDWCMPTLQSTAPHHQRTYPTQRTHWPPTEKTPRIKGDRTDVQSKQGRVPALLSKRSSCGAAPRRGKNHPEVSEPLTCSPAHSNPATPSAPAASDTPERGGRRRGTPAPAGGGGRTRRCYAATHTRGRAWGEAHPSLVNGDAEGAPEPSRWLLNTRHGNRNTAGRDMTPQHR